MLMHLYIVLVYHTCIACRDHSYSIIPNYAMLLYRLVLLQLRLCYDYYRPCLYWHITAVHHSCI